MSGGRRGLLCDNSGVRRLLVLLGAALVLVATAATPAGATTRGAAGRHRAVRARPAVATSLGSRLLRLSEMPRPAWWHGTTCDTPNDPGSHAMGAVFDGLVSCGPGPTSADQADKLVRFTPSSWGEYEWECVELSMRWMYLAWGVHPYPADGYDTVSDYAATRATSNPDGPSLETVPNPTPGRVPQPGDVVSTAPTTDDPLGHTAVVSSTAVDSTGDGTITLIQDNGGGGNDGWVTYPVHSFTVGDGVTAWLHDPAWSVQSPLYGFVRTSGLVASRLAVSSGPFRQAATGARSVAVAGASGPRATPLLGVVSSTGDFSVAEGSPPAAWHLEAHGVAAIALAEGGAGANPAMAYVTSAGTLFALEGSIGGTFVREATGIRQVALSERPGGPPVLGALTTSGRFEAKVGLAPSTPFTSVATGVRQIALAGGSAPSSELTGWVTRAGRFELVRGPLTSPATLEASGVTQISLASVGSSATPLLGAVTTTGDFLAGTARTGAPARFSTEATGVAEAAVAAGTSAAGAPILAYLTVAGQFEAASGSLTAPFALQSTDVAAIAVGAMTYE